MAPAPLQQRLRVKDIDFEHNAIAVRQAKGGKDRVVMLPTTLLAPLQVQLARARGLWPVAARPAGQPARRGAARCVGAQVSARARELGVILGASDLHARAQCGGRSAQPDGPACA